MRARPAFHPGEPLFAEILALEQEHRFERLRRHGRYLHGYGVVCGLLVTAAPDPWTVRICPGYAVTPCGDEVEVCCATIVDLREKMWGRPPGAHLAWLGLRACTEPERPAAAPGKRCGCDPPHFRMSRLREHWCLDILWDLPRDILPHADLCASGSVQCPPSAQSPYVVLARVELP